MLLSSKKLKKKESEQALLDLFEAAHFEAHSVVACPGQELSFNAQQILSVLSICSFRHSPFWTTTEPLRRGHKNYLKDSFSSIFMYFFHVEKLQSEGNCVTRFEYFLTSLSWIKKINIPIGKNVSQSEILAQAKPMAKSHQIQSDTWFYSGLDVHDKWKFNYTFMHCYNPLFICSELLTFFVMSQASRCCLFN